MDFLCLLLLIFTTVNAVSDPRWCWLLIIVIFISLKKINYAVLKRVYTFYLIVILGYAFIYTLNNLDHLIFPCGIVLDSRDSYVIIVTPFQRLYSSNDNNLRIGQIVYLPEAVSELDFYHLESQFDFEVYLNQKGVIKSYIGKKEVLIDPLFALRFPKEKWLEIFNYDSTKVIFSSLIFKEKDYSSSLIAQANKWNILSLITDSGVHITFAFYGYQRIFQFIFKNKKIGYILSLTIIAVLFVLNPTQFAFWRLLLKIILTHTLYAKAKINRLRKICLEGVIWLSLDPFLALQAKFYLPFSLRLTNGLCFHNKALDMQEKVKRGIKYFLVMLPFLLKTQGSINLLAPFLQLLLLGYTNVLYLMGAMTVLLPPFGLVFEMLCQILASLFTFIAPIDKFNVFGTINFWHRVLYYASFLLLEITHDLKLNIGKKLAIVIYSISVISPFLSINNSFKNGVYFINVGQGDAILLRIKNQALLIDTGGSTRMDIAQEVLIPFFRRQGVKKINAVIITHNDFDHNGALNSLQSNFLIENIYSGRNQFPITFSDIILHNLNIFEGEDDNEQSLVIYMEFMSKKWLFMGDAPMAIEDYIIQENPLLQCDVIKIGHHGSNTSTGRSFIEQIQPNQAVISVGKNSYGHPHQSVLDILTEYEIEVRRTDKEGTIYFV
ncbi:MAG TPA: MBL fold metallo-hydrolase [Bacilli bacterium]|nr:MBL fold metallo-hydrolase [Bacilli bacterium]